MKSIKSFFKFACHPCVLLMLAFFFVPLYLVGTKPLKAEPNAIEMRHAKRMATYLTRNDCKRLVTIPGRYACKDGLYNFREIEVLVWQEMQY